MWVSIIPAEHSADNSAGRDGVGDSPTVATHSTNALCQRPRPIVLFSCIIQIMPEAPPTLVEPVQPLPINPELVWDYRIPAIQDEAFRHWYIARVLTRGQLADIQAVGLPAILAALPHLHLPVELRRFWDWYANLPAIKARYGIADAVAANTA